MKQKQKVLKLFVFIVPFLFMACNGNEPESEVFYKIANAELIPLGELVEKKSFVRATFSNDTAKWHVRTVIVMESDTLETVSVSTIGKRLIIKIETEPYDNPDWWDLEKLTNYYDIKFDVIGLKKGMYNAELHMNNTSTYRDSLVLE